MSHRVKFIVISPLKSIIYSFGQAGDLLKVEFVAHFGGESRLPIFFRGKRKDSSEEFLDNRMRIAAN
jgi:hypothetical protein